MVDSKSNGPTEAMIQLSSPDGYYTYLGIKKPSPSVSDSSTVLPGENQSSIDEDMVKKNFRKLSLKHHPDKKGGDVDTFRMLKRAQTVLLSAKLRQQYDILGMDLDDDDEHHGADNGGTDENGESTTSQGIVHEIASTILASVFHLLVRTTMMGVISVLVVRYRILILPALLFLGYIAYRIKSMPGQISSDLISPILLAVGLIIMFQGRNEKDAEDADSYSWSITFWFGEALVIGMFTYNSLALTIPKSPIIIGAIAFVSILLALWFRGKMWNYLIVIGIEGLFALFVVVAFPVMEMVLEAILNEKLKKAGDKIRAHQKLLEEYYTNKMNGKN